MASNLNVTELDFDQIKLNLKNFLKSQSEFNDYDFDGSGMSVLLDVLSYNTHYNAVAAHYSLNEAFLDSAQIRGNVVTRAKLLGYTPRSVLSPRATVNITVDATSESTRPAAVTLQRGSKLTSNVSGESFTYVVLSNHSATLDASTNTYVFSNVVIVEGTYKTLLYRVDNDIKSQKFQLTDKDADTSTLRVRVQQNEESTLYDIYTRFESLLNIDSGSQVFYLQENPNEKFEIYFGDGVTGKKPVNDNIVTLDYIHTKGKESNGASAYTFSDTISGLTSSSTFSVTSGVAAGGADRESIESIRFNAPLTFTAQNRAVTSDDYRAIIIKGFANISSISTWGGEDNDPVDFGKVYISIKPLTAATLTDSEKTTIKSSVLKGKNIVSITPEIVDPNFTNIELDVFFKYNPNLTDRSSVDLQAVVRDTISDFNFNQLNKFDGVFRHSQLLQLIDSSDPSILNSTIRPYMHKTISGKQALVDNDFALTFASPFFESGNSTDFVLSSSAFKIDTIDHFFGDISITDSTNRRVIVYKVVNGVNVTTVANAGLIVPSKGTVTLNSFALDSNTNIKITLTPNSLDIAPKRDQLLNIEQAFVNITAQVDTISTAGASGSIDYTVNTRLR